jgi:hypothetical protein
MSHCARFRVDPGPPAIALTMTMPHGWANINIVAVMLRRRGAFSAPL